MAYGLWETAGQGAPNGGEGRLLVSSDGYDWDSPDPSMVKLFDEAVFSVEYGKGWYVAQGGIQLASATIPMQSLSLEIAGCQTDGFVSGELIVSEPAGGGKSVIIDLDDTQVRCTKQGAWAIGQKIVGP